MTRVWLNGFEQISCLGVGAGALAEGPPPTLDAWSGRFPHAGVTQAFDFAAIMGGETPEARQMDQLGRFTVACAALLQGSGPRAAGDAEPGRTGVMLGSAFGCTGSNQAFLETLVAAGPRRASPVVFRNTVSNAAAGHLAVAFRLLGSNSVLNSGMVSGVQAMAYAYQQIADGSCEQALSGAADWTSELVRRRFASQAERYGRSALPQLDGAGLFRLGSRREPGCDWELAGFGLGFLDRAAPEATFLRVLRTTLERAGVDGQTVDALHLQQDTGALWLRSGPRDSLEATCTRLVQRLVSIPSPENTALPITLGLATSLRYLAGKGPAPLFLKVAPTAAPASIPRRFLFAAIGADGNAALLLFKHVGSSGKDA
jgi:hypothetical protein